MSSVSNSAANQVIVGIDFGTTFSGVAFTWSDKIERIEVITSWDSLLHSTSDEVKAPTTISFGAKREVKWGYSIPGDIERLQWFKLLLIDEDDLPRDVKDSDKIREARKYLAKNNKTPTEVISVYLRHLWNHAVQRITETIGKSTVNFSKFHVVITLPAIWPSYARNRMREAAKLAGILGTRIAGETELTFLSEPEAAAISTLADMEGRIDVKSGDTFVVADCGGGTVDLISYQVTKLEPMIVKECVKGSGGLCGAVFVDEAFLRVLKEKFTKKRWKKMESGTRERLIHDEWHTGIKQQFDQDSTRVWTFNMPWDCLEPKDLRGPQASLPKITLHSADVKRAFDPVVNKIMSLIEGQVISVRNKTGASPKYVIMVGGFGRCKYLFEVAKERFSRDIEVLQSRGPGPWTAICRGAVVYAATMKGLGGLSVQVQSRIARASYGACVNQSWDPSKHQERDKYWCERDLEWKARDQMVWLLREGDDISTKEPITYRVSRRYTPDASEVAPSGTIYQSVESPPSSRCDSTVTELCSIKWQAPVDVSSLPTSTNPVGKVFHKLSFEYHMECSGASVDFALYHNGKRQGSRNVKVEYSTR